MPIEENLTSIKKKSIDITPSTINKSANRFLAQDTSFAFIDEISDIGFEFDKEIHLNSTKNTNDKVKDSVN